MTLNDETDKHGRRETEGEKQFKSAELIIFIIMSQYLKFCAVSEIYLNDEILFEWWRKKNWRNKIMWTKLILSLLMGNT